MSDFKKLQSAIEQSKSKIGSLTADQMANAMVHMDRMAPSFGRSHQEFRTIDRIENNVEVLTSVSQDQFSAYLAHKSDMLAKNSYVMAY